MRSSLLGKYAQRRRRTFKLKNGFYLEFAWHYGKKMMAAEYYSPSGEWKIVYSNDRKELFSMIRIGIAELENPKIRYLRLIFEGKISAEKGRFLLNSEN